MNKRAFLFENFIVYGIGNIMINIIPFIMLPILIRIIPNSSYYLGINDLFSTVVSLVSIVGLMGIYDALFRLFFECEGNDNEQKNQLCSTALAMTFVMSTVCALGLALLYNRVSEYVFGNAQLGFLVIIASIAIILNNVKNIVMTPTRMLNQKAKYIIGNVLAPIVAYAGAFFLTIRGYYIVALPLGMILSQIISIFYFYIVNRQWFSLRNISKDYIKPILSIGIPLFPTFITFWIFSSLDRYMIARMINANATGMYAVASKLAGVSQLITSAFTSGWSYFAFSTMKDEDQVSTFTVIVEYILAISIVAFCACRLLGNSLMAFLYTEEYSDTGRAFAYLFLAPIIAMIFQLMGSQFLILKKTLYSSIISWYGCILNIVLNYLGIREYGIDGAAIASVVAYMFIVTIASIVLFRKKMFIIRKKYYVLQCFFWLFIALDILGCTQSILFITSLIVVAVLFLIYYKEICYEFRKFRRRVLDKK